MANYLKVKLNYSGIARQQRQKDTLRGLGLRFRHQTRILKDTPAIRGMIQKVLHLVSFEETKDSKLPAQAKTVTYKLGTVKGVKAPKAKVDTTVKEAAAKPGKEPGKQAPLKTTKKETVKPAKEEAGKKAAPAKKAEDKPAKVEAGEKKTTQKVVSSSNAHKK